MKRSPLRRTTPMPRPTVPSLRRHRRLNPVSAKRRNEAPKRLWAIEEARYRDGDRCYAVGLLDHACTADVGLDAHEVIPRSVYPDAHLDPGNIRLVCRSAHQWIGDHPREAASLGLHGWAWELRQ